MMQVHVGAASPYEILIEKGALGAVGEIFRSTFGKARVALISDATVDGLYGDRVEASLVQAGFPVVRMPFAGGEENKTLGTVEDLLSRLLKEEFTRSDLIVALGGGITGDIAGFVASVYLRGIRYVQLPTTLLAALDSSVGGKTGVNLGGYKNQIGAFHQPSLVLCDPEALGTLSEEQYADGMAEAIKYGVAFDRSLFELIYSSHDITEVIRRCVTIKADVVRADEHDTGVRRLLNFGHTVGHAIEKLTEHEFTHGQAVAVGMIVATRSALRAGYCEEDFLEDLVGCITWHGLPRAVLATEDELVSAMRSDKKRLGDEIALILPKRLGECRVETMKLSALQSFIKL